MDQVKKVEKLLYEQLGMDRRMIERHPMNRNEQDVMAQTKAKVKEINDGFATFDGDWDVSQHFTCWHLDTKKKFIVFVITDDETADALIINPENGKNASVDSQTFIDIWTHLFVWRAIGQCDASLKVDVR